MRATPSEGYQLKLELSPNGRAKCRCCNQKIQKVQERVSITKGKQAQFYHKACLIRSKSGQNDSYFWRALTAEIVRTGLFTGIDQHPRNNDPEVIVIDYSDDDEDLGNNNNNAAQAQNHQHDDEDDDDDDIVCEETLTNAQVIQQKFDRAAANGEIVSID